MCLLAPLLGAGILFVMAESQSGPQGFCRPSSFFRGLPLGETIEQCDGTFSGFSEENAVLID